MLRFSAPAALLLAAVLLTGCAPQEPEADSTPEPEPTITLVTLDEAKQTAQDDIAHLLSLIPAGYIDGEAEIPTIAEDIQPCELGSDDEWRWASGSNFDLTTVGRGELSTADLAQALADDDAWELSGPSGDIEQGDPIFLVKSNGQPATVYLQPDDGTGRVAVQSPCFSLPGGPVDGEEY